MQIAPSGYWRHAVRERKLALQSSQAQRYEVLSIEI
jgi:hypothetical protein